MMFNEYKQNFLQYDGKIAKKQKTSPTIIVFKINGPAYDEILLFWVTIGRVEAICPWSLKV